MVNRGSEWKYIVGIKKIIFEFLIFKNCKLDCEWDVVMIWFSKLNF